MSDVRKIMDEARNEKHTLIKMILSYQNGNRYSKADLDRKNLNRLREIYDAVVHHAR